MSAQERRLVSSRTSKLGKADLVSVLRSSAAWDAIPARTRVELYAMLPEEIDLSTNTHPLSSILKDHIVQAIREWQSDLKNGCEEMKWRHGAVEISKGRKNGKWRELEEILREEHWGLGSVQRTRRHVVGGDKLEDDDDDVEDEDEERIDEVMEIEQVNGKMTLDEDVDGMPPIDGDIDGTPLVDEDIDGTPLQDEYGKYNPTSSEPLHIDDNANDKANGVTTYKNEQA